MAGAANATAASVSTGARQPGKRCACLAARATAWMALLATVLATAAMVAAVMLPVSGPYSASYLRWKYVGGTITADVLASIIEVSERHGGELYGLSEDDLSSRIAGLIPVGGRAETALQRCYAVDAMFPEAFGAYWVGRSTVVILLGPSRTVYHVTELEG